MKLLKKEYWWLWLLLVLVSGGSCNIILADLLDCFEEDRWYTNYKYWLLGIVCFFLPFIIMFIVFIIQMTCICAAKLKVSGKEIYLSPYIWLLCIIIPIIGWILFLILLLYLQIKILINLYSGDGEKYI